MTVLSLDLMLVRDGQRFQQMCFRLARCEFPGSMPLAVSWDGGRDAEPVNKNETVSPMPKFSAFLVGATLGPRTSCSTSS